MSNKSESTLYEEEGYTDKYKIKYPKYGLVLYISLLLIPTTILALGWSVLIIDRKWDWYLFAATLNLIAAIYAIWYAVLRTYWQMYKTYRNYVKVTTDGIKIGKWYFPREEVKKSMYNVTNGFLYIYRKNGRKFKICKDISRISYFGGGTHFSHIEYEKALKKIGVPFEVIRKRGFRVEPIRGREAYREMKHKERYEKWLKSQKNNKNSQTGGVRK